jgi:hypothetical protein
MLLVIVAILQGWLIAVLIFVIKYNRSIDKNTIGGSLFATILATIGLGCVACGTSLLVPIVGLFASSSASVITKSLTTPILALSILITVFSLYRVGLQASTSIAHTKAKNKDDKTVESK